MKSRFTDYNKNCPQSCINRALTLEERYKMFSPQGLGGTFQFNLTRDAPNRSSCVVIDLMGPYKVKCHQGPCTNKVWLLLLLNPATQFLAIEILENQSSAAIVSALIRHMSKHGTKKYIHVQYGLEFLAISNKICNNSRLQCGKDY